MDFSSRYDENTKQWSCPAMPRLFDMNCSTGRVAYFMMKSKPPHEICQISDSEGTTLTYGTTITYAIRIAQHLQKVGLTQDDVVGVIAPNTTLLLPLAIGCFLNGTPFHAINPIHEAHVIGHLFTISKPKIIFCGGEVYEKIRTFYKNLQSPKVFTLCNHLEGVSQLEDLLEPTETELFYQPQPLKYGPTQTAALYCSSGTTGLPKVVPMTHLYLTNVLEFTTGSDVMLSFSTLDWTSGLYSVSFLATVGGKRIITTRPYSPDYLLELVAKYKISFLFASHGNMAEVVHSSQFTKDVLQSIRFLFMTGGPLRTSRLDLIRSKLSGGILMNSYGNTELGGISANISSYKPKSVGKILPNVTAKIVNTEDGSTLGPNEVGELYILSTGKWSGYYGNEKATEEAHDSEGFFRTGDLGYFDEEHYLHLVDRCKDVMKYNGMHFVPSTIEDTIAELPDVLDVCVFGIADEFTGDMAAAAVMKRYGSALSEEQIVDHVSSRQSVEHKRLHAGVVFVQEIFRNPNGKVLRSKVKEIYQLNLSNLNTHSNIK